MKKSNTGPIVSFSCNAAAARFWFVAFCIATSSHFVVPIIKELRTEQEIIVAVVDETGTIHITPGKKFSEENRLHYDAAIGATISFTQRSWKGPDFPHWLKDMYGRKSYEAAIEYIKEQQPFFKAKGISQTPKIERVKILKTSKKLSTVIVEGYFERTGTIDGFEVSVPDEPFKLRYTLIANPDLKQKGRYPLQVNEWKFEPYLTPVASNDS